MSNEQHKTKRGAPKPSGFSSGATQEGSWVKASDKAAPIKSPKDQASCGS